MWGYRGVKSRGMDDGWHSTLLPTLGVDFRLTHNVYMYHMPLSKIAWMDGILFYSLHLISMCHTHNIYIYHLPVFEAVFPEPILAVLPLLSQERHVREMIDMDCL